MSASSRGLAGGDVVERALGGGLRGAGVGVGLLGRGGGGGDLPEHVAGVAGDGVEGRQLRDELLDRPAGHQQVQLGHAVAGGEGGAGDLADPTVERVELRPGLDDRLVGAPDGGLLMRQRLPGLVDLLGDDLELVRGLGDQLRGLRGARGVLRVRDGGARQQRQGEGGGGSQDQSAGDAARQGGAAERDREVGVELIDGMPQGRAGGRHGRRLSVLPQRPPTELADGFGLGRRRPISAPRRTGAQENSPQCCGGSPVPPRRRCGASGDSAVTGRGHPPGGDDHPAGPAHRTGVVEEVTNGGAGDCGIGVPPGRRRAVRRARLTRTPEHPAHPVRRCDP